MKSELYEKNNKLWCEKCKRSNHNTKDCYFSKYCQLCDKTNHSIDECNFNKWCEICGRVNHNTDECYYQERSKPVMKGVSKKSVASVYDEGFYDTWTPRNMRMTGSSQYPNKQFVKSNMKMISRIASHPHSQDSVKRNLIKQFLDEPGPSHVVPSV